MERKLAGLPALKSNLEDASDAFSSLSSDSSSDEDQDQDIEDGHEIEANGGVVTNKKNDKKNDQTKSNIKEKQKKKVRFDSIRCSIIANPNPNPNPIFFLNITPFSLTLTPLSLNLTLLFCLSLRRSRLPSKEKLKRRRSTSRLKQRWIFRSEGLRGLRGLRGSRGLRVKGFKG